MADARLVVVKTFGGRLEAEIARGALEAAGIDAIIGSDTVGHMREHIAWSGSGFQILVRAEDVEAARELLRPRPFPV